MQLKLKELMESRESLAALTAQKPSARMAYTLGMVLNAVNPHYESYSKAFDLMRERYFVPNPENPELLNLTADTEKREAYKNEMQTLLDTDVALDGVGKIKASVFESEGVKLTPQDIYALRWLIKPDMDTLFEKDE